MNPTQSLHDSRTQSLYKKAKSLIPGGTQLLSKRPELYAPEKWPAYYQSAQGCEVVDLDGRRYIDMASMGIGACLLGFNDLDVSSAVIDRVRSGSMSTLNAPEEVEVAELLLAFHPWAEKVRYARSGGEAMAIAVRIARSRTDRSAVAFCGYHGWHDWYLAANRAAAGDVDQLKDYAVAGLSPQGVPAELAGTVAAFSYNRFDELEEIFRNRSNRIAAVVMEPTRSVDPAPGFLQRVRELCDQHQTVLIFDEITAGWRLALGGAHLNYGVAPDIAVFAKAIANGHPMAAIVGRADTMEAAQKSFISSTAWTEAVGPAAALATLRKFRSVDVPAHVARIGNRLRQGLAEVAARHEVPLIITGHPALTYFNFNHPDALAAQTLLTVRMLDRGFLSTSGFYPALTHTDEHVDRYLQAAEEVFAELGEALRAGDVAKRIGGPIRHGGFQRLA